MIESYLIDFGFTKHEIKGTEIVVYKKLDFEIMQKDGKLYFCGFLITSFEQVKTVYKALKN